MGEAKRRGTPNERTAQATHANRAALDLLGAGDAPHYAFIFDRSERGQQTLESLRTRAPDEIRERLSGSAMQLWEGIGFEYVIVLGSWGYTGGLTLPTADLPNLMHQALPTVMERILAKGGICSFLIGVAAQHEATIQARLAELQPIEGTMN